MMEIVPNPKKSTFPGCFAFPKFPENKNISRYMVLTKGEGSLSEYLSTYKERNINKHCNFIGQEDLLW